MTDHSPTPWKYGNKEVREEDWKAVFIERPTNWSSDYYSNNAGIYDANDKNVITCDEYHVFESKENVDFLLRAVNAHADLVAALRDALEYVRLTRDEFEHYEKTEATIKAALAKAGV